MVGDRVKSARTRLGLTQAEAAEKAGMSKTALRNIEQGQRNGSPSTLSAIAAALGVTVDWLLADSNAEPAKPKMGRPRQNEPRPPDLPGGLPSLPLVGDVGAGPPVDYARFERLDFLELFGSPGLLAVRVQGDSMIGAGILSGDYAVLRQQPGANSGEIVLAWVDGGMVLKELRQRGTEVMLLPHNDQAPILRIERPEDHVFGVLIGVIRRIKQ